VPEALSAEVGIERTTMVQAALAVAGLAAAFEVRGERHLIFEDLNVHVNTGEVVGIVGSSGVGKSTLLRCLSGLLAPAAGTVSVGGELIRQPHPDIAVIFQDYSRSLLPWMKVIDNVAFPLRSKGIKHDERLELARAQLAEVGLSHVEDRYPWQLSGGMQQRVAIARALAYAPKILMMDEPFASLDAQTRFELEDLVLGLRQTHGMAVVVVTHDVDEAVYMSDRVIVLSGSPACVVDELIIELPAPRDQLATKAEPLFAEYRSQLLGRLMRAKG
jgi:NitT/TauT family transport system ATP-binding protein